MKDQILKIAGVKSEKEFYKKYPTEAAFKKAHPKAFKKAEMGASMVKKQLEQLTDWSNPPQAQNGFSFADALSGAQQNLAKSQQVTPDKASAVDTVLGTMNTIDSSMGLGGGGMSADGMADMAKLIMRNGGQTVRFQGGGDLSTVGNTLKNIFTTPGKAATATSAATPASGGLGDTMKGMFGQDPAAFGKANPNGALGKGGQGFGAGAKEAGFSAFGIAPAILGGVQAMQNQKKAIKKADQAAQISGVVAQASESRDISKPKNQYVRPEDQPAMGAMNPQGTGTNFLAQYGAQIGGNPTEIQNMYNPGDLYSDLGYEPLNDSNVKQFAHGGHLPTAEFGDYFQDSGQAQIGGATGEALGTAFFGPIGGKVGKLVGNVAGNLLGGAQDANRLARYQTQTKQNTERSAVQQTAQSIQGANASFMENGGWMNPEYNPQMIAKFGDYSMNQLLQPPHDADMLRAGGHLKEYTPPSAEAMQTYEYGGQMAMGGDLQVHRGKAEPISYNPFLPDGGETVMFKGPSHDNGGMPISYGQNGVEVEGGEPAVKLADGGSPDGNLVVFGNMKIDDMAANHIGVEAAKGKKYKRFIDDLSKFESRQNTVSEKGIELINSANTNDPFERLSMNSGNAMMMGSNAKLLNAAIIKQRAAGVQNAILDTAKEHGVKSDQLAQGKYVKDKDSDMAKFGAKLETAQNGISKASAKAKWKDFESEATSQLKALYPGKKVQVKHESSGVYNSEGGRPITTQAGLQKSGNSQTPVSLHNFDAAKDYNIYVDGKLVNPDKNKDLYAKVLWDSAAKTGLYHVGDKKNNWDPRHIGLAQEGQGTAFNELHSKYPEIFDNPNAIQSQNWLSQHRNDSDSLQKYYDWTTNIKPFGNSVSQPTAQATSQPALVKPASAAPVNTSGNYYDNAGNVIDQSGSLPTYNMPTAIQNQSAQMPSTIGNDIVSSALGSNYNPNMMTQLSPMDYSNFPKISSQGAPSNTPIGGPSVPEFANLTDQRGPNYSFANTPEARAAEAAKSSGGKNKFDWKGLAESAMSNVMPLFRPTNQEALDPSQLYPEMFALASNQLEPVRAQQFQPMLKEAYNISLQDQLNEVDSQVRAATRQIGGNPAAAAQIFASAADAKNKIRGEQMRINQAQQAGVRNENIGALNQAQMQNLQILDQQYGRQAEAKSKTKAQTLEALKSIATKTAQNKLENRQLGVMENMYNYRFGPKGQAINYNDPQQYNMQGVTTKQKYQAPPGKQFLYDEAGTPQKMEDLKKNGGKVKARNGSIVKALKTL